MCFQGLGFGIAVVPLIGLIETIAIGKAFGKFTNSTLYLLPHYKPHVSLRLTFSSLTSCRYRENTYTHRQTLTQSHESTADSREMHDQP